MVAIVDGHSGLIIGSAGRWTSSEPEGARSTRPSILMVRFWVLPSTLDAPTWAAPAMPALPRAANMERLLDVGTMSPGAMWFPDSNGMGLARTSESGRTARVQGRR